MKYFFLILAIAFLFSGVLTLYTVIDKTDEYNEIKDRLIEIEAENIYVTTEKDINIDGPDSISYISHYTYEYNGDTFSFRERSNDPVGNTITIIIDPLNPENRYDESTTPIWVLSIIMIIVGAVFAYVFFRVFQY